MPKITFLPGNKTCEVPSGTTLQQAAQKAGIMLSFPCACKGVCGKCLVKIQAGTVDFDDNGKLPRELREQGFVLACRAKLAGGDMQILLEAALENEQGQFSDAFNRIGIASTLFPTVEEASPLVRCSKIAVAKPELLDGLGDYDRFTNAIGQAFGVQICDLPLNLLQKLPDTLRQNDGNITVWYTWRQAALHIVDISAEKQQNNYGLAVDIGTTTVAVQLVDVENARVLDTITLYNAQINRGADVISRISYAKDDARIAEMRELVVTTINEAVARLCKNNGISPHEVHGAAISANTTMTQMFMGIKAEFIRLEPYTPAVMAVPVYTADALGLTVCPNTPVWISPNVGSYVGGDITAGLLCTDFALDSEEINLFIDIGTNGEIVLGNNEFLLSCACSAGPAFEGGGIEMGMRASVGAIENVAVDPATGACQCTVIGGGKAQGICGSGLISLVAQLFENKLIDPRGKLDRTLSNAFIDSSQKNTRYYIVPKTGDDNGVYITDNDLDNFIRAKAAIFSACVTMLNSVELDFGCISKFYIAGGFGRYIALEKSQVLGLLPLIPQDKFLFIGNSSLTGSFMALVSQKHREKVQALASRITYMDLSTEPAYMDEYVAAMFLPHTDLSLFQQ